MNDDERAIRALVDRWMSASMSGDLPAILELMTDDVIFLVPGKEPFGKAEFAAASAGMKNVAIAGTSEIQELAIVGDWAHLRNHIEMTITPQGGTAVSRAGHTLTILRKCSDGKWRLSRDANLLTVTS